MMYWRLKNVTFDTDQEMCYCKMCSPWNSNVIFSFTKNNFPEINNLFIFVVVCVVKAGYTWLTVWLCGTVQSKNVFSLLSVHNIEAIHAFFPRRLFLLLIRLCIFLRMADCSALRMMIIGKESFTVKGRYFLQRMY